MRRSNSHYLFWCGIAAQTSARAAGKIGATTAAHQSNTPAIHTSRAGCSVARIRILCGTSTSTFRSLMSGGEKFLPSHGTAVEIARGVPHPMEDLWTIKKLIRLCAGTTTKRGALRRKNEILRFAPSLFYPGEGKNRCCLAGGVFLQKF